RAERAAYVADRRRLTAQRTHRTILQDPVAKERGHLPRHIAISVAATLVIAAATLATWKILENDYRAQNARIVASESQAARSQLARNLELMLGTLRSLHRYWATYGHLPRDQWATDVHLEPLHLEGIDLVFWSDAVHGVQYARTPGHPEL